MRHQRVSGKLFSDTKKHQEHFEKSIQTNICDSYITLDIRFFAISED